MKVPTQFLECGFYYHYKHDPNGSIDNYAHEVIGVGCHTEDDCRPEDANMVIYRPLYESLVYKSGKFFELRPLEMWFGNVTKDGVTLARFTKITDPAVIMQLEEIKRQMYDSN